MVKRKKAFVGAIVGAVSSLVSTGVNLYQQNKAAKEQAELDAENKRNENNLAALEQARNLSNAANNSVIEDEYNNKFAMKYGGKRKLMTNKQSAKTNRFANSSKIRLVK